MPEATPNTDNKPNGQQPPASPTPSTPHELQGIVKDIEVVPETLRGLYVRTDRGDYRLNAAGLVEKSKLDEFRQNNIDLMRANEELTNKYKDVNLDDYRRWQEDQRKNRDKKMIDEGKVDELVNERVTVFRKNLEDRATTAEQQLNQTRSRLETVVVDGELQRAALAAECEPTAVDDIVNRGRSVFRYIDDQIKPMHGDRILTGEDGVSALTIKEWMANLQKTAPHLFKASRGGGASNGPKGGGAVSKRSDLKTTKEKSDYISEHGQAAYLNLPL